MNILCFIGWHTWKYSEYKTWKYKVSWLKCERCPKFIRCPKCNSNGVDAHSCMMANSCRCWSCGHAW